MSWVFGLGFAGNQVVRWEVVELTVAGVRELRRYLKGTFRSAKAPGYAAVIGSRPFR